MGHVRVTLDHDDYAALDEAMRARKYRTELLGNKDGEPRWLRLPPGSYWREEPTDEHQMRIDATAALTDLGELGWSIVATSGETSWDGLIPTEDGPAEV